MNFYQVLNEMPWVDIDGEAIDLELERVRTRTGALMRIRKAMRKYSNPVDKYEFINQLITTFPEVLKKFNIEKKDIMENLVQHAERELAKAGLFDKDSDYEGMIGTATPDLVKQLSAQGHSGCSAAMVIDLFNRLAKYKTLTPVSNCPEEWMEVTEYNPKQGGMWQSRRCPSCFSTDGGKTHYDIDANNNRKVIVTAVCTCDKCKTENK